MAGSRLDVLLSRYTSMVAMPWDKGLAPEQRVWMVVYPREEERRLRYRLGEFSTATHRAGHPWKASDFTTTFPHWIVERRNVQRYFEHPAFVERILPEFEQALVNKVVQEIAGVSTPNSVVALTGLGALFGFVKVSSLIEKVAPKVPGRLAVFFPGTWEPDNNYRFLEATDGWNYLAVPITSSERDVG